MPDIEIPYGKTVLAGRVDEKNFLGCFHSTLPPASVDETAEVRHALDAPFDSPPLEELASKAENAVVISSDHTREQSHHAADSGTAAQGESPH